MGIYFLGSEHLMGERNHRDKLFTVEKAETSKELVTQAGM